MIIRFYNKDTLESTIYADFKKKEVRVENHTEDILHLAFGINTNPAWEDFEEFLEDRCPPRTRANIKEILEDLGLSYYEPIDICEKTNGRTEEDNGWMDIARDEERE